jgi:hypothetical protein
MPSDIVSRFQANLESPAQLFERWARGASFRLEFGSREINMLRLRPWDDDRSLADPDLDLVTLQKLISKGVLASEIDMAPPRMAALNSYLRALRQEGHHLQLSQPGHLLRQLLVCGAFFEPDPVSTDQNVMFDVLLKAVSELATQRINRTTMKIVEQRMIDGDPHLVVRLSEGPGRYSEWAVPKSAIKRIG